jgi:thiol-disulfide isomerase/thioredoxin
VSLDNLLFNVMLSTEVHALSIRYSVYMVNISVVLVLAFSGCTLFRPAGDKPETNTPYPPPLTTTSKENVSIEPKGRSSAKEAFGSPYPAPAKDRPGQGSIASNPYPAPSVAAKQGSAYPAPTGNIQATSTPIAQDTPARIITNSNPYPLPETPAPNNPVQTPGSTPASTTLARTEVITSTLPATPSIVRTDIIASDPAKVELSSGRPQLVEFFGYWCILCKSMAPVINGLETKYKEKANFIYLNVDDPKTDLFKEALGYSLIGKPHLYLLDGQGKTVNEWIGYVPVEELEAAIISIASQQ